ncbi:MAG: beta-ketoacyl-[acyl-carrier-protein] synthase family protein [bacterium]
MENNRRVVVTGMGVVAPNGIGIDNFWDSLVHGRSGVRKITHFDASSYPSQIAAEVLNFDPTDYMDSKTAKRLGRFAQFALASAHMAVKDSGIDFSQEDPYRAGVYIGTAMGGEDVNEIQHSIFLEKGLKRVSPLTAFSCSTHSASAIISCEFKLKGANTTIAAGCNSGLDAFYLAYNAIRLGDADFVIVGAGEAPITPYIFGVFCTTGFLSTENEQPERALKPYDLNAGGTVLGEGGGILIIEELRHALERGANIYGEVLSYSSSCEAFDFVGVDSDDATMASNFKQTLSKAGVDIREVAYINAHGNGMLSYDVNETRAIKRAFGELSSDIVVASIKPVTGQSFSATGVFQIIATLLAIKHCVIPPTINLENPAPQCDLNYARNQFLQKQIQTALINAHGFGGRITTLLVGEFMSDKAVL